MCGYVCSYKSTNLLCMVEMNELLIVNDLMCILCHMKKQQGIHNHPFILVSNAVRLISGILSMLHTPCVEERSQKHNRERIRYLGSVVVRDWRITGPNLYGLKSKYKQ